ncbi:hypothetical protein [Hyperthermus butylicus]|nr:hypothetical protein [Hyperthermus butylicus]
MGAVAVVVIVASLKFRSGGGICVEIVFPRLTRTEVMRADTVKLEEILRSLSRHVKVKLVAAEPDMARLYVYGRDVGYSELTSLIRDYTEAMIVRPCSNGTRICAVEVASIAVAERTVKRIASSSTTKTLVIDFKGVIGELKLANAELIELGNVISVVEKVEHALAAVEKSKPSLLVLVEPLDLTDAVIEHICSYAKQCIVVTTSSDTKLPPCTIDI